TGLGHPGSKDEVSDETLGNFTRTRQWKPWRYLSGRTGAILFGLEANWHKGFVVFGLTTGNVAIG
ncbi:MAG: hypothetical protein AAGB07_08505, partial [Pseudomonadota bacterium]